MSKRKQPSETFNKKRARVTESKELTEEENIAQLNIENEIIEKANNLLNGLNEENVDSIDQLVNDVIKKDRTIKTKNLRFSSVVFETLFNYLIKAQNQPDHLLDKIQKSLNLIRMDVLPLDKLNRLFETFVSETTNNGVLNEPAGTLISKVGHALSLSEYSSNITWGFEHILNNCKNLNGQFMISLLITFNSMMANKNSHTGEQLLKLIFDDQKKLKSSEEKSVKFKDSLIQSSNTPTTSRQAESNQNTSTTPSTKSNLIVTKRANKFKWNIEDLGKLVQHSLTTISFHNLNHLRTFVYEKLMELFIKMSLKLNKLRLQRPVCDQIEKTAILKLTNDLDKNEDKAKHFFNAFKSILEKYSLTATLSRFIVGLYLSVSDTIHETYREELSQLFLKSLETLFDIHLKTQENKWLESCLLNKNLRGDLTKKFNYETQSVLLEPGLLAKSLISICKRMLDKYGQHINEYLHKPNTISECFSLFVSQILLDLFKSCKSSRDLVINKLLKNCIHSNFSSVYIDQLEVLLNNKEMINLMFKDLNESDKEKLSRRVLYWLTGRNFSNGKSSLNFKSIFDLDNYDLAVRLLHALRTILSVAKKDNLNSFLIKLIDENSKNSNLDTQKICAYGFVTILKAINTVYYKPEGLADETERTTLRKADISKTSLIIFDKLKAILTIHTDLHPDIKSYCYESFNALIKLSSTLIEPILKFLLTQMENVLIRNGLEKEVYFDLGKCISEENFRLIEPIDVLFHCTDWCCQRALKLLETNSSSTAYSLLHQLKTTINQIIKTYLNKDSKYLFEIYQSQIIERIKEQNSPGASMKIIHQLELGLIDAMIDHCVSYELFVDLPKLLDRYDSTSTLISQEIEDIMNSPSLASIPEETEPEERSQSSLKSTASGSTKRKLADITNLKQESSSLSSESGPTTSKKLRSNSDKENRPPSQRLASSSSSSPSSSSVSSISTSSRSLSTKIREPLSDITTQTTQSKKSPHASATSKSKSTSQSSSLLIKNFSCTNFQFEHVPRVSYKSCLKMIQICIVSANEGTVSNSKLVSNESSRNALISVLVTHKLTDYVMKIIEKKLKDIQQSLDIKSTDSAAARSDQAATTNQGSSQSFSSASSESNRSTQTLHVYDPQSLRPDKIFDFLSKLWLLFCQRINGSHQEDCSSIYTRKMTQSFNQSFFIKTHRYIQTCQTIWSILSHRFQRLRAIAIHDERQYYASNDIDLSYPNKSTTKISYKLHWKFLLSCVNTIKLYMKPTASNLNSANKCCTALLNLMYDVLISAEFTSDKYENFLEWLGQLAERDISSEGQMAKSIVKLMIYLSNKHNSPVILLKNLSFEYYNFVCLVNEELPFESEFYEPITLYNLINNKNTEELFNIILENLVKFFTLSKWSVDYSIDFDRSSLIISLCSQLEMVVHGIGYLIGSVSDIEMADLFLETIVKFYEFMNYFIQSKLMKKLTENEIDSLKDLFESITTSLQNKTSSQLNRIKDLIIIDEDQKDKKTEAIKNMLKYKQLITSLFKSIEFFEKNLLDLNEKYKSFNLIENYKLFIASIEITSTLESKTIIVSENQLKEIFEQLRDDS